MKMFLLTAAILAVDLPPTHASTMVFNNGSAVLIAQTDSEGVFKTEAATRLVDETRADITGAVVESRTSDNSSDQTLDSPAVGQVDILSLVITIKALCPARPSQAFEMCPYGIVGPRD